MKGMTVAVIAFAGLIWMLPQGHADDAPTDAMASIQDWSDTSKQAVQAVIQEYGQPSRITGGHLFWADKGTFKRIRVQRFPERPFDVLQMTVNYEVPEGAATMLDFGGESRVTANPYRGEITASGDRPSTCLLALNLANEVLQGDKSMKQALQEYRMKAKGNVDKLSFDVPSASKIKKYEEKSWSDYSAE